jgi:type III secretion protein L
VKFFSLLFEGDIYPSDAQKLIPADEYSKLVEAAEVVEKARIGAERLQKESEEICHKHEEDAKKRGFQEGLEQFNTAILKMDEELRALRLNLQQLVLPIALKAAKRIVAKELEIFPETIVDIVIQAIQPISESRQVTVFVNKGDKESLDRNKPKLKEIFEQIETFAIQERSDVEPGGCIIKTESGMINASIENQWRALERAFDRYKQNS